MSISVSTDLRSKLGEARDQRQRPTCLAFAASAAHEASRATTEYLSIEYLFYIGSQRSHGDPNRGLSEAAIRAALHENGQPAETSWPYEQESPDVATWKPPAALDPCYRAALDFTPRTATELSAVVVGGKPVIVVLAVTLAMYTPDSGGVVRSHAGDTVTARKHAMLAVGSGSGNDGHYILVRNSWGREWGADGHGWLHHDYLNAHAHTTAVIS